MEEKTRFRTCQTFEDLLKLTKHVTKVCGPIIDIELEGSELTFTTKKEKNIFEYAEEDRTKKLWDLQRKI